VIPPPRGAADRSSPFHPFGRRRTSACKTPYSLPVTFLPGPTAKDAAATGQRMPNGHRKHADPCQAPKQLPDGNCGVRQFGSALSRAVTGHLGFV
jgi:hypothetical protein